MKMITLSKYKFIIFKLFKKSAVCLFILFFLVLDLVELEKKVCLYNNYEFLKHKHDASITYDSSVQQAEFYVFNLGQCLFNQAFDSAIVKQLLLWYAEQDLRTQSIFSASVSRFFMNFW